MGSTNTLEGDVLSLFFCLGKESTSGSCWKIGILDEGNWKKFSKVSSYFMLFLGCLLDLIPPNRFFGKVWYVIFVWGWCKSQLMVDFWFGLVGGLDSWGSSMKGIGILRASPIRKTTPSNHTQMTLNHTQKQPTCSHPIILLIISTRCFPGATTIPSKNCPKKSG